MAERRRRCFDLLSRIHTTATAPLTALRAFDGIIYAVVFIIRTVYDQQYIINLEHLHGYCYGIKAII